MGLMRLSSSLVSNVKSFTRLNSYRNINYRRDVPKGHMAVYVGKNNKRRFVVPVSYLEQPLFQDLLHQSQEEFGFDHPMGGLTISCHEDEFVKLTALLHAS
ncbi:Auxin responsive SAUR protein [Artemisia annua]|uniref:Auxin responsive SAUR protein n=1 Tax=Artemisia annua TaxID=35608 RepID=A0A2U1MT90_ARTAN|nr:Auxin responsive SAUR protein [Artemisia annua]